MAEIIEFEVPSFLQGYSAEMIQEVILANITDKMDKSEGSVLWDLTNSTALVLAEVIQYVCVELVRNMVPMWAEGSVLDSHGRNRGLTRKKAEKAHGIVKFLGTDGTEIKKGTKISTTAVDNEDIVVVFETMADVTIELGSAEVEVQAVLAGADGNVAAGRIDRMDIPDENILNVTNEKPLAGGLEEETDDEFRQRIIDKDEAQGVSYIGSMADYKRWAMSVSGVGNAIVSPSDDGSGLITIVITDVDGNAASEEVCTNVYNYIMQPENPSERIAPINAVLRVIPPHDRNIAISAKVVLSGTTSLDAVKSSFMASVQAYYKEASEIGIIKYNKISSILMNTGGVSDFSDLLLNGGTANVVVAPDELIVSGSDDVAFQGVIE